MISLFKQMKDNKVQKNSKIASKQLHIKETKQLESYKSQDRKAQQKLKEIIEYNPEVALDLEDKVLELGYIGLLETFAEKVPGANVKRIQEKLLEQKLDELFLDDDVRDSALYYRANVLVQFAKNVKGADVEAIAQVIIDSGDYYSNYQFAKEIETSDLKAHMHAAFSKYTDPDYYSFLHKDFIQLCIERGIPYIAEEPVINRAKVNKLIKEFNNIQ